MSNVINIFTNKKQKTAQEIFLMQANAAGLLNNYKSCCVCNFHSVELVTYCNRTGYTFETVVPLCPNHALQFKGFSFTDAELEKIQRHFWTTLLI